MTEDECEEAGIGPDLDYLSDVLEILLVLEIAFDVQEIDSRRSYQDYVLSSLEAGIVLLNDSREYECFILFSITDE